VRPFLFWVSVEVALLKALHTEDIRQGGGFAFVHSGQPCTHVLVFAYPEGP
jgi:hypothetical protein